MIKWLAYHVVIALALEGATIIFACRNPQKSKTSIEEYCRSRFKKDISSFLKVLVDENGKAVVLDLSSFRSIQNFAGCVNAMVDKVDVLVNSAGTFADHSMRSTDGFDMSLAVNFLAPVLLTQLLLPFLEKSNGRIVNVTAASNNCNLKHMQLESISSLFDALQRLHEASQEEDYFSLSKFLQIHHAVYLAEDVKKITAISVNPGYAPFER